ncbi:monofunctional biosynthetic peptidoglycan transglycosylase [Tolumonas lignilytica]|uniref:monofunctional biosynthetic peptidoglycan transglycosylase n=1 Tax=Tolumonas lignilytica TaxID=1283284 RepID=UPI0004BBDEA6|nr:monofunctional biosynthetic peptidoglycan transglycosylase [Tolumonas lignilytica]
MLLTACRNFLSFENLSWKMWLKKLLILCVAWFFLWHLSIALRIVSYNWFDPSSTAFMDEQMAILQLENPAIKKRQTWVPYPSISNSLKRALIAAEDAKFLDHDGFDWDGIENAWEKNLAKGKIVAGGSTISQQLAKNLFLSANKTPWRKLDEAVITVMLETILDKQRIYELYLNVIEWGSGIYGAEAAAQYYFGIPAKKLTASQSAYLAAMVTNPRFYQTHRRSAHLLHKAGVILKRMHQSDIPD